MIVRRSLSLLTATLIVAGLAGCSSSSGEPTSTPTATSTASACQNVKSGSQSESVKVSGDFRKIPSVTIPTPLKATGVERTVLIEGTGAKAKTGASVDIALAAYNGTTGKELTAAVGFNDEAAQTIQVDDTSFVPGLVRAVECLSVGSRIVLTAPAKDAFGSADISQLGLTEKDSAVFVVDVIGILPTRADGTPVDPQPGFPTVKLGKDGAPTVTIPKTDPPTETKIAVLKQGDGDTVGSEDTVILQYSGVLWRTGKVFDSSWNRGEPLTNAAGQFVPGFTKAIVGQKVGSQVIVVIPPADGYGTSGNGEIKGTDTMVFVIDILKTSR